MKKLTLSVLIASAMSLPAMAGDHDHKISTQFSALDSDGNGVLDKEELKDSQLKDMLSKVDSDGDHTITRGEFDGFVDEHPRKFSDDIVASVKTKGTTDAMLTKSVSKKVVSRTEGEVISEKNRELRTEMHATADVKFDKVDKNNDGELTLNELTKSDVKGNFDKMDMDENNLITRMEYRKYFDSIDQ